MPDQLEKVEMPQESTLVPAGGAAASAADRAKTFDCVDLAAIAEHLTDGIIVFDAADRIAFYNQRYKDVHPTIADLVEIGKPFSDMIREAGVRGGVQVSPDGLEEWVENCVKQHLDPGEPFVSHLKVGISLRIAEYKMPGGGILGVHSEITEVTALRARVDSLSAGIRALIDGCSQAMAFFDNRKMLVAANAQFQTLHGLPAASEQGLRMADLFHGSCAELDGAAPATLQSRGAEDGAIQSTCRPVEGGGCLVTSQVTDSIAFSRTPPAAA
jgi:PAS domain-containing protein